MTKGTALLLAALFALPVFGADTVGYVVNPGDIEYFGTIQYSNMRGPVQTTIEFREGTVGGNGSRGTVVASFGLTDLPYAPADPNGPFACWTVDIDLTGGDEFVISPVDFGYSYFYADGEGVEGGGPFITSGGAGNEDQFYSDDPNIPGADWTGWSYFGGNPHAGYHMKMWDASGAVVYDNTVSSGFYYSRPALDWGDLPGSSPITIAKFQIGYCTTAVPEPGALLLLGIGAWALYRRRA